MSIFESVFKVGDKLVKCVVFISLVVVIIFFVNFVLLFDVDYIICFGFESCLLILLGLFGSEIEVYVVGKVVFLNVVE